MLQDVAEDLGGPPTTLEMNEHGECTSNPAYRFWDSWSDALEAADLAEDF
jgi:hypothetical protein